MGSIIAWFPQIQELQDQNQTLERQINDLRRDIAVLQNAPVINAPVINALVVNAPARNAPTERQIQRDKMEEVRFWDFYWPGSICPRFRSYLTNL
jgi:hypothetical protein